MTLISRGGARIAMLDRRPAAHKVILRALPLAISQRFDPSTAGDLEAVFELRVRDPAGRTAARFELAIASGACDVRPGAARSPGASAELGADDMIRLVSGATGWPELLSSGRLELSGDPFLALRFPALFRLPAYATP
jgi:SCP-2 sterol transfer family